MDMYYQREIDFIKNNYNVTVSDEVLIHEIRLFIENIRNKYDYDFSKHKYALADVVIHHDNVGEDGLTQYAKNILGEPKLSRLQVLDWSMYGL